MAEQRARLGDLSSHGGHIITASGDVLVDGLQSARVGDMHVCPISGHNVTPIVTGSSTVQADGRPVAVVGLSKTGCGATIVQGAPNVLAG